MRRLRLTVVILALLPAGLAACSEANAVRVDERTFEIEGPGVPGGAVTPNRRLAEKLCPRGYRVLDEKARRLDTNIGITTYWTVRCL